MIKDQVAVSNTAGIESDAARVPLRHPSRPGGSGLFYRKGRKGFAKDRKEEVLTMKLNHYSLTVGLPPPKQK